MDEKIDLQNQLAHGSDNRQTPVVVAAIISTAVATVIVLVRLWSRRLQNVSLWYDDYVVVLSLLLNSASTMVSLLGVRYGLGRHAATLQHTTVVRFVKVLFAYELGYTVVITLTKFSILLMYHRIFPLRHFTRWLYVMAAITTAWCITCIFGIIFQCTPTAYFWDRTIEGGHCVHLHALYTGVAGINIATDLAILLLPVREVWKLNMKIAQKGAVSIIFLLGGFVCVASLVRALAILKDDPLDVTYSHVDSTIWCCVETFLGIICACLPVMWPVIVRFVYKPIASVDHRLRKSSTSSSGHQGSASHIGSLHKLHSQTQTFAPMAIFSFHTTPPKPRPLPAHEYRLSVSHDPTLSVEEGRGGMFSSVTRSGDHVIAPPNHSHLSHSSTGGGISDDDSAEKSDHSRSSFPRTAPLGTGPRDHALEMALDPMSKRGAATTKVHTKVTHDAPPPVLGVLGGVTPGAVRSGSTTVPRGAIKVKKEVTQREEMNPDGDGML